MNSKEEKRNIGETTGDYLERIGVSHEHLFIDEYGREYSISSLRGTRIYRDQSSWRFVAQT